MNKNSISVVAIVLVAANASISHDSEIIQSSVKLGNYELTNVFRSGGPISGNLSSSLTWDNGRDERVKFWYKSPADDPDIVTLSIRSSSSSTDFTYEIHIECKPGEGCTAYVINPSGPEIKVTLETKQFKDDRGVMRILPTIRNPPKVFTIQRTDLEKHLLFEIIVEHHPRNN